MMPDLEQLRQLRPIALVGETTYCPPGGGACEANEGYGCSGHTPAADPDVVWPALLDIAEHAEHLLAGGGDEAVYHLRAALSRLDTEGGT